MKYPKPVKPTAKELAERDGILALEQVIGSLPEKDQYTEEEYTEHYFAPGVYARMFFIPKGGVVVGKLHKTEHFNIICTGHCRVSTEDGVIEVLGPCIINSEVGVKKAVFAIEDTTWVTIHVTEETDLKKIEDEVIANDYDEIEYKEG